uniref:Uncharacterized protein n=1 Tax=viral metagenome TaxID=1070528 RepID=A0A6C0INQ9_9ZZZZ
MVTIKKIYFNGKYFGFSILDIYKCPFSRICEKSSNKVFFSY